ncbi:MAG: hypothetical protein WC662_04660 [Candidatus Paceibacterota bacterium]|jgi:DNA-binding response OmpR family regulator
MKPTIFIVEDDLKLQMETYPHWFKEDFILLQAYNLEQANKIFSENPNPEVIIMDGCLGGDDFNTGDLVKKIRETYNGPIIATSSTFSGDLVAAGCNYQSSKKDVGRLSFIIKEILKI